MAEQVDPDCAEELKFLGERIKQARTERGLSVRDMVIRHNYHDAQWRRFEKGASLTVPSLLRIAKALGTSLSILLDGIGEYSTLTPKQLKASDASTRGEARTKRSTKRAKA